MYERLLEGIENQTTAQTVGRQGEERHQALYHRWHQLMGMTQLARMLGVPAELREAIQAQQDQLRDELRAGG